MRKHISEDGQIRDCHAKTPESCTAKGPTGEKAEHFENTEMAKKRSEELQEEKYGRLTTLRKPCTVNKKEIKSFGTMEEAKVEAEKQLKKVQEEKLKVGIQRKIDTFKEYSTISKEEKIEAIDKALKTDQDLKVTYVSTKGEWSRRVIKPHEFLKDDKNILVGIDREKGKHRRFVVDNILDVKEDTSIEDNVRIVKNYANLMDQSKVGSRGEEDLEKLYQELPEEHREDLRMPNGSVYRRGVLKKYRDLYKEIKNDKISKTYASLTDSNIPNESRTEEVWEQMYQELPEEHREDLRMPNGSVYRRGVLKKYRDLDREIQKEKVEDFIGSDKVYVNKNLPKTETGWEKAYDNLPKKYRIGLDGNDDLRMPNGSVYKRGVLKSYMKWRDDLNV